MRGAQPSLRAPAMPLACRPGLLAQPALAAGHGAGRRAPSRFGGVAAAAAAAAATAAALGPMHRRRGPVPPTRRCSTKSLKLAHGLAWAPRWCRARLGLRAAELGAAGKEDAKFSFDVKLWRQFVRIAEPYFVPLAGPQAEENDAKHPAADGVPGFFLLITALMIGVVSGTYWLALGLGSVAKALLPAAVLPAGLPGLINSLVESSALPATAGVALVGAAGVFLAARQKLEGRWVQWGLLGLLLFLLFSVTGLNVLLSYVFRTIDNVLVAKDAAAFYQQLSVFAAALVVAVPVISGYRYVRLVLGRRWRQFLTDLFLEKYLKARAFYLLDSNSQGTGVDNPDQRIAEDTDFFTRETLDFLLDILDSVLNLLSFSAILWATSQQLTGALVLYALLGSTIALVVGSRLIGINYEQLRLQADFRYSLVHIRDNAEAIAFYGGEGRERQEVSGKLESTLRNFDQVIVWTTGLSAYQKAFFYLARLVPYFVLGGLYFSGQVDFGTLGQAQFAFSMVLSSVTLIVSRIQDISRFSAGVSRLGAFWEALDQEQLAQQAPVERIATTVMEGKAAIEVRGMTLLTPDGSRVLLERLDMALAGASEKRRLLIVGSSGVGKSSVLRAIAGLWTRGGGEVKRPPAQSMLFLPQKPYMPLGDLRTQLLYPAEGTLAMDEDAHLREVLATFGLADLPDRFPGGFDAMQDWTRVLSLGEQQRLAAARCLTTRPRFVVLDEATSALPLPAERVVYDRLAAEPSIEGYISVGHRPSLARYHDVVLEILGGGAWRLLSPEDYVEGLAGR